MKQYLYRMHKAYSNSSSGLSHFLCGDVSTNNKSNNQSFLQDSCVINYVQVLPHTIFVIISISILVLMSYFCQKPKKPFLIRSRGHNIRWSLFLIFLILLIFQIEEGLLSDLVVSTEASSQPDLYIPAIVAFIGGVTAIVYFHHVECWQEPIMCLVLILYWACALTFDCLILINLGLTNHMSIDVMRWDMTVLRALLYAVFLFLDLVVLGSWVCQGRLSQPYPEDLQNEEMKFYQGYSNLISTALFMWMQWLFKTGYKRTLEPEDLGSLSQVHTTEYQRGRFERVLQEELRKCQMAGKQPNLFLVMLRVYGWHMSGAGLAMLVNVISSFIIPLILAETINSVGKSSSLHLTETSYIHVEDFFSNGFVLVVVLFIILYVNLLGRQLHIHIANIESAHVKSAIQAAVYNKALRLSTWTISGGEMTTGQITNHMSVDATNILNCFQWIHYIWAIPLQLAGFLVILYYQLGFAPLISCLFFLLAIPFETLIAKFVVKYQKKAMEFSDTRLKQTNEMLQGIKLIKLYAWEEIFERMIADVRGREIGMLLKAMPWRMTLYAITIVTPALTMLLTFVLYSVLSRNPLTPDVTFVALSVFNSMYPPFILLPRVVTFVTNAYVSTKRLKKYFCAQETEKVVGCDPGKRQNNQEGVICKVSDGDFVWDKDSSTPTISNINLEIPAGKLTIVVGPVGSGKSSLISAILGEMTTLSGSVDWNSEIDSHIAYASQKAWLLNASLRDNILFGNPMDPNRYKEVIEACSLQPDIDILPGGDQTEIGEKGINLSGGQKQRVSVARAMYSPHAVVILDDPLSALDVHVGAHLFENGIMGMLKREERTVVLVTHQVQYLESAEKVLVMENGAVVHDGTYQSITDADPELAALWRKRQEEVTISSESEGELGGRLEDERMQLLKQISLGMEHSQEQGKGGGLDNFTDLRAQLIEAEEREKGSVPWTVYRYYFKAFNFGLLAISISFMVAQFITIVSSNFWLSAWADNGATWIDMNSTNPVRDQLARYAPVYSILSLTSVVLGAVGVLMIIFSSLQAAKKIHNKMLATVILAPMRFFDTTPVGRILNRFSSDVQVLDVNIGDNVDGWFRMIFICVSSLIVNLIVTYYFVVVLVPVCIIYVIIWLFAIPTCRELKRIESITRSPVFAHFSESLGGLSTIRAYRVQDRFMQNSLDKIEQSNVSYIYLQTANRWLGVRLDFLGALTVLGSGLACMAAASFTGLSPSLLGLALTYVLYMAAVIGFVFQASTDMELQMNSVERIAYYSNTKPEKYEGIQSAPSSWPSHGYIQLTDVHARYAPHLDPVLSGLNVEIKAGEKIGICGRTGSGKSSLVLTLFRVIDVYKGAIFIDGQNIADLPLKNLRRSLSIIPQDPILFTGTIRFNLDPFHERTDDDIWEAIEIAQLKKTVQELANGLDSMVTEGGENFSVGQRQLFCLARAFLRKSRILVMDEATASIDIKTDTILQEVVSTAFQDRTVLTIAHRVSSILDSDKIITLDGGAIVEYGDPQSLLKIEGSIFSSLVSANQ
ncbi:ATP-binding cassette sub-family C member 8 [Holothuria leucospilota]|uniref:ATP-binding cassette sub-family C member 8 n=1 Tax=Holothuria leucospilota TaxID=206669 RepID=A0A9Q1HFB4_HOLLE|nr:ATP-binding cassette sub-family C member 8 [Holothuria leucospilota]